MRPPINFRDSANAVNGENLGRTLDWLCQQIENRTGTTLIRTIASSVSGGSGGGVSSTWFRTDTVAVSAGSQIVSFRSAVPTTDYRVVILFTDSDNAVSVYPPPTAKSLTGFTQTYSVPGTVEYFAFPTT